MAAIHKWFPKVIYVEDGILIDKLGEYENLIKAIMKTSGVKSNGMLSVDSTHQTNDKLHLLPQFAELVDQINIHAKQFLVELGYLNCVNGVKISNMWANISHENDFIYPHVHPNSLLSGVFYIKKYPGSTINFFDNLASIFPSPDIRNDLNYEFCEYDCNPGRLLMWKSDFVHGTKKQDSGEKIIISFNMISE